MHYPLCIRMYRLRHDLHSSGVFFSRCIWWCLPFVCVCVTHSRKAIQKVDVRKQQKEKKKEKTTFPSDNKQESFIVVLHIECRRLDTGRRHFADVMSLVYVNCLVWHKAHRHRSYQFVFCWDIIFVENIFADTTRLFVRSCEWVKEIVRLWHKWINNTVYSYKLSSVVMMMKRFQMVETFTFSKWTKRTTTTTTTKLAKNKKFKMGWRENWNNIA